jgi:hypothetical protein
MDTIANWVDILDGVAAGCAAPSHDLADRLTVVAFLVIWLLFV